MPELWVGKRPGGTLEYSGSLSCECFGSLRLVPAVRWQPHLDLLVELGDLVVECLDAISPTRRAPPRSLLSPDLMIWSVAASCIRPRAR